MRSPSKIGVSTVMSKKCPAESQGSLVVTTSPGLRLLAKMRTRCAPAIANELMWPGVPVLACATMRPRRSNRAQARSPASRTTGLKAMRCNALARSVTMPIRLDHRISSSTPSIALFLPRKDTADLVNRRSPVWWNHRRGLALFDDRRTFDVLAHGQGIPIVDRHAKPVAPGMHLPHAFRLTGSRRQGHRPVERDDGAAGGHPPSDPFDGDMGRIDAVKLLVGRHEYVDDPARVVVSPRVGVEGNGQFALLAEITKVGGEDQSDGFLGATGLFQG